MLVSFFSKSSQKNKLFDSFGLILTKKLDILLFCYFQKLNDIPPLAKFGKKFFIGKSIITHLFIPNLILRSLVKNFFKMVPLFKNYR